MVIIEVRGRRVFETMWRVGFFDGAGIGRELDFRAERLDVTPSGALVGLVVDVDGIEYPCIAFASGTWAWVRRVENTGAAPEVARWVGFDGQDLGRDRRN